MTDALLSKLDNAIKRKGSVQEERTSVRLEAAMTGLEDLINLLQSEHKAEIKKLKSEIEMLKARDTNSDLDLLETAKKELTSIAGKMKVSAEQKQELEAENQSQKEKLEEVKAQNEELRDQLEVLNKTNQDLSSKIEIQSEEIEQLKTRTDQTNVNKESSEPSELEPEIQPQVQNEEISQLKQEIEESQTKAQDQNEAIALLQEEIEELKKENARLEENAEKVQQQEKEIRTLQEGIKSARTNSSKHQKDAAKARRSSKKIKEKAIERKGKIDTLEKRLEELDQQRKEAELKYITSQNELQSYQSQAELFRTNSNVSDLSRLSSTREGGVFFDDEVDEEELLEAFVKRFPRERTLSSPTDLLKKRDPGDALNQLHSESTVIISSLQAENEKIIIEKRKLELEKEAFLSELAMLRTDPILKKNFGNDSTENVGGATMSPNSAAIDLDTFGDFPDIPVRTSTTSMSPKAVVNSPRTGSSKKKDWKPQSVSLPDRNKESWAPPKRSRSVKKSVEFDKKVFQQKDVSWKPKLTRPKLTKDDSDIDLSNPKYITKTGAYNRQMTLPDLVIKEGYEQIMLPRRHTVSDIYNDPNNDDKKEEEAFRRKQMSMANMISPVTHLSPGPVFADDASDISEDISVLTAEEEEDDETDVPTPKHFFSFDNDKTGLMGMVHMGVPFPRVKNFYLFYGFAWKSYLMTQKRFRLKEKGWTLSIFFKCNERCLLDMHNPLTLYSKGPLKKSTSVWVQRSRKDGSIYVYTCVNCVYDNQILKLPLQTEFRDMTAWHHVSVRVKGRKAMLLLDEQTPIKGNLISRNNRNRFQTTGSSLYVGCSQTSERRGQPNNFFHGNLYNLAIWEEALSLLQIKKVQQSGFYNINTYEHALKQGK